MSATPWVEPFAGFQYLEQMVSVAAAHQQEKLAACGIDAAVFGEHADPAFFIGMAIHAGIQSGISAEGNINMLQQVTQHRPVRLGESLSVRGQITQVTPVPRGVTLHTEVSFCDLDGDVVITANRVSLKPDPDKAQMRGAGEKPPPIVTDHQALQLLDRYTLTPAGVKSYSSEGNSIHYEEAAALRAGFRAPLIGGGQGVHFLTATLWRLQPPQHLNMTIYFRRPIFWDETVQVAALTNTNGRFDALALLKENGKIGTEIGLT